MNDFDKKARYFVCPIMMERAANKRKRHRKDVGCPSQKTLNCAEDSEVTS